MHRPRDMFNVRPSIAMPIEMNRINVKIKKKDTKLVMIPQKSLTNENNDGYIRFDA